MSLKEFADSLKVQADSLGQRLTADNLAEPNRYCFTEDNSAFNSITVRSPSLLIPTGTPATVEYVPASSFNRSSAVAPEVFTAKNGVCFLFLPGTWNIRVKTGGSGGSQQCFVLLEVGTVEAAQMVNLLQANTAQDVNLTRVAGSLLTATTLNDVAKNEAQAALAVRAGITGLDSSLAANSRNVPIEARALGAWAGSASSTPEAVLSIAQTFLYDLISNTFGYFGGASDTSGSTIAHAIISEGRRSGYYSSRRGRRFTAKSPNQTGVAAATAFVTTTPTYLLVNGATNEAVIRRIIVTLPAVGTSTSFVCTIKTDTADRFSAGGTTRTPATMNNGNVVAATQARSLEAPTATAEGGGTRDIYTAAGTTILTGAQFVYEPEDGLIIVSGGSLLLYVVTATAGATVHYVVEYEDANVQ